MDVFDLLKVAADWSLAAVMAGVLVYVIKDSNRARAEFLQERRDMMVEFFHERDELVSRVVRVVEANTEAIHGVGQALKEIKAALDKITDFMVSVDRRLAAIEAKLEGLAARGHTF